MLRGLGRQASVRLRGIGQSLQETGEAVAQAVTQSLNEGSTLQATRRRRMSVSKRAEAAKATSAAAAATEAKDKANDKANEKAGNKAQKKEKSWSDSDSDEDSKAKAKKPAGITWVSSMSKKDEDEEAEEANLALKTKASGPSLPATKQTSGNGGAAPAATTNTNTLTPAAAAVSGPPDNNKEPLKPQAENSLASTVDLTSSLTPSLSASWGADDCSVDHDEAAYWGQQAARQEQLRKTRSLFRK